MYRFFDKYGKKLMAVFGVLLMIGWSLGSYVGKNGRNSDSVAGKYNGGNLTAADVQQSFAEWGLLKQEAFTKPNFMSHSLVYVNPRPSDNSERALFSRQAISRYINVWLPQHPALYALLVREAEKLGCIASTDQVQQAMKELDSQDPALEQAVAHFLAVDNSMNLAIGVIKTSDADARQRIALLAQQLTVNVAVIPYDKFAKDVKPPTTQQAEEQFERYRNSAGDDAMSFGYLLPNRVKLQFIGLSHAAIAKSIQVPEQSLYVYYLKNPDQFPSTQPAHHNSLSLDNSPVADQTPSTQPASFSEAHDRIAKILTDQAVAELQSDLTQRINAALTRDYSAFVTAGPAATQSTTAAPMTPLGVSYNDPTYLTKLADWASLSSRQFPPPSTRDSPLAS